MEQQQQLLLEWAAAADQQSRVAVAEFDGGQMRGVQAKEAIARGRTVLQIPRANLITVEMGKKTPIGQKLLAANVHFAAPKHIFLLLFLLTDMNNKKKSRFQPYYETLPTSLSNMPVFWSPEELTTLLKGSYILKQIADRKAAIKKDYDAISLIEPSFATDFSLDQFSWARMIACSRNFGLTIDGIKTAALVPVADMLNHYRPRQTSWTFDQEKQSFVITALQDISPGDQIYDSYGKKCNHRFLLNYGFAIEDNIEEDGQNPNEVMIFLSLNQNEGNLYLKKKKFLIDSGDYSMDTRFSCRHTDSNTREGFSFARLIVCSENEFEMIRSKAPAHKIPPISIENEIKALILINKLMCDQLEKYDTTLDEDNEILKNRTFPLFSNRCQALIFLRGEKQVCHHFIKLVSKIVPLLELAFPDCMQSLLADFENDDDISNYAQDVVEYLLTKAYPEHSLLKV